MADMYERWQNSQKKRKEQKKAKTSNTTKWNTNRGKFNCIGIKVIERCGKSVKTGVTLSMPCILDKNHKGECRWREN